MLNEHDYRMEILHLYGEMAAEDLENDNITDNDEWEKADRATAEKYMPRIQALEHAEEMIRISAQPKSEWFIDFCKSLRSGQRLTPAQQNVFRQYARAERSVRCRYTVTTYRVIIDGLYYCLASGKIFIEQLELI